MALKAKDRQHAKTLKRRAIGYQPRIVAKRKRVTSPRKPSWVCRHGELYHFVRTIREPSLVFILGRQRIVYTTKVQSGWFLIISPDVHGDLFQYGINRARALMGCDCR